MSFALDWEELPEGKDSRVSVSLDDADPADETDWKHQHEWLFCAGGGNGVTCAIGSGRHILPSAESEAVARLIEASQRFGEIKFHEKLLQTVFDPEVSPYVRMLGIAVPHDGFSSAAELRAWIERESILFDEFINTKKKKK